MKLNVQERLTLVTVVPEKGNFDTMKTVEKLKNVLYLSEEELDDFSDKNDEGTIIWNDKANEPVEVEISALGFALLLKQLSKLDKDEQLTLAQFKVYEKLKEIEEKTE